MKFRILAPCLLLSAVSALHAAVKPNALFSDNAVLQQGVSVPIWGTANDGEKVTVSFAGQNVETVAREGKWKVALSLLKASETPQTMTIAGENTITINNVLVGEVWVCSGQSNMEFTLDRAGNADTEIPVANYPKLRMFTVGKNPSLQPLTEETGAWQECSPQTAPKFSAVGYFFGRDLIKSRGCAVGMINTSWGGTVAQAWTSLSGLEKDPRFKGFVQRVNQIVADFPKVSANSAQDQAAYQVALKQWQAEVGRDYNPKESQWSKDVQKAKLEGKPVPPKPVPARPKPVEPPLPMGKVGGPAGTPTLLYNGMVSPLLPYAIKGVIWYQGESNVFNAGEYRSLFPRMIADWREKWNQGAFPFLFVQIAPYNDMTPDIRDAQLITWKNTPNTAMVVTTDVGDAKNIHPKQKEPVGDRLALAARALAYGEKIEYSGPVFDAIRINGNTAVLTFTHSASGLVAKDGELKGFVIAGSDHKFVPAAAKIAGNTVVVSSPDVARPTAVRYGWANVPDVNLFNKEGLPATPFGADSEPAKR